MTELKVIFSQDRKEQKELTFTVALFKNNNLLSETKAQPFHLIFDDTKRSNLQWYFEEYGIFPDTASEERARSLELWLLELGREIFNILILHIDNRNIFNNFMNGNSPRLLTFVGDGDTFLHIPWECIANKKSPLSLQNICIRRQHCITPDTATTTEAIHLPIHVLIIACRPEDLNCTDSHHSTTILIDALSTMDDRVVIDLCASPSEAGIIEQLVQAEKDKNPYTIVYLDCYGDYNETDKQGSLFLEKPDSNDPLKTKGDPISVNQFGKLCTTHSIPLIILDIQETNTRKPTSFGTISSRLAIDLIQTGVPSILTMSQALNAGGTAFFFKRLFKELITQQPISQAVNYGRISLLSQNDNLDSPVTATSKRKLVDWFLPQLYQSGNDYAIIKDNNRGQALPNSTQRRLPAAKNECGAFPPLPLVGFIGRQREFYTLAHRFIHTKAIVLLAPDGTGKTTFAHQTAFWFTRLGIFSDGVCYLDFAKPRTTEEIALVLGQYVQGRSFNLISKSEQGKAAQELFKTNRILMIWDNVENLISARSNNKESLYSHDEKNRILELYKNWTQHSECNGRLLIVSREESTPFDIAHTLRLKGFNRDNSFTFMWGILAQGNFIIKKEHLKKADLNSVLEMIEDNPQFIALLTPFLETLQPESIRCDWESVRINQDNSSKHDTYQRTASWVYHGYVNHLPRDLKIAIVWLDLFEIGVFEDIFLNISQLSAKQWQQNRKNLVLNTLISIDHDNSLAGRPFIRLHPSITIVASIIRHLQGEKPEEIDSEHKELLQIDDPDIRRRFMGIYYSLNVMLKKALAGDTKEIAMNVITCEERNIQKALVWTIHMGGLKVAQWMGGSYLDYLRESKRFREMDSWTHKLQMDKESTIITVVESERIIEKAWTVFNEGNSKLALTQLEDLQHRLKDNTDFCADFQIAKTNLMMGRIYYHSKQIDTAISVLQANSEEWNDIIGQMKEKNEDIKAARINLSVALGSLTNALLGVKHLDEALIKAKEAFEIEKDLADETHITRGLIQIAQILFSLGNTQEANDTYERARTLAQKTKDVSIEAHILQAQAEIAENLDHNVEALQYYTQVVSLLQSIQDNESLLVMYCQIAELEHRNKQFEDSVAWYKKALDIAQSLNNKEGKASVSHSLGILMQSIGENESKNSNRDSALSYFNAAKQYLEQSLGLKQELSDEQGQADAFGLLAQLNLITGDLDKAKTLAEAAREIDERLGSSAISFDYYILSEIEKDRGNTEAALEWEHKMENCNQNSEPTKI